jgi:RNA polymerase sigma-70 factor (ECF subfamily)
MTAEDFQQEAMKLERLLFRICWSQLNNSEDCADAVQEALMCAWNERDRLRSMSSFKPWLTRIVANTCSNMLRKRSREKLVPLEDTDMADRPAPEPLSIKEAIDTLSPDHRAAVTLHYLEGYSVRDTARLLHIPVGTAKTRLMYARQRLQTLLRDEWEG